MSLLQQIKSEQLAARKAKDSIKATLLTTLMGEAQAIGKNDGNRETTDDEVLELIKKFLKGAKEMIELSAGKADKVGQHSLAVAERDILLSYLPTQLTGATLEAAIKSITQEVGDKKSDMGKVMQALKAKYDGQYDGKEASVIVKGILN